MRPYELPSDDQAPIRQQAAALAIFANYQLEAALDVLWERPDMLEFAIKRVSEMGIEDLEMFLGIGA